MKKLFRCTTLAAFALLCGCCRDTAPSAANSPLLAYPDAKKMNFISIVYFNPDQVPYMIEEAKRAAKATGVTKNAYSMSIMPTGKEPIKVVERYAETFGRLSEGLKDSEVQVGILVQSLVGHGWAGAATSENPMEYAINQKGITVYRHCMLDPKFRKYTFDAMVLLAKQRPAFFLMDDDMRTINNGPNGVECFCDSHMKIYNAKMPRKFASAKELIAYLEKAPADDPCVKIFEAERRATLLGYAKLVRDAIDSVDPSIKCGYCSGGGEYLLAGEIARILAGKNESFLRINDGNYLEGTTQEFNQVMYHCAFKSRAAGKIDYILDESDTCPHSRYAKSAVSMHSHITGAILNGASGGKLWITNLMNKDVKASTSAYERILKEHRLFYDALLAEMPHVQWLGPVTPLVDVSKDFNPARALRSFASLQDWQICLLNRYGIPAHYEYVGGNNVYMLDGTVAECLTDAELKTILSGKAIVDGYAALNIADRGMAEYLGCTPKREFYRSSGEKMCIEPGYRMRHQNNGTHPKLTAVDSKALMLGELSLSDKATGKSTFVAPGTILYHNPAGGTVITRSVAVGRNPYNDRAPEIKIFLLELFRRLDPQLIPFYVGEEQPVYFRCGKLDNGGYLLALVNLGFDELPNIDLRTYEKVRSVEFLDGNGVYQPLKYSFNGKGYTVEKKLSCYDTLILRVR